MLAVHSCRNVRYHVHGIVAVFWLSISMTCKGAFVLQGELVSSATAASSIISIDVFAQAVGDETIAGFTVPFDLPAVPGAP